MTQYPAESVPTSSVLGCPSPGPGSIYVGGHPPYYTANGPGQPKEGKRLGRIGLVRNVTYGGFDDCDIAVESASERAEENHGPKIFGEAAYL